MGIFDKLQKNVIDKLDSKMNEANEFIAKKQEEINNLDMNAINKNLTDKFTEKANQALEKVTQVDEEGSYSLFGKKKDFCCFACGSTESIGSKKTVHGKICFDCIEKLEERNIEPRQAKHYSADQIKALCSKSLSACDVAATFVVSNPPIALRPDEKCYYVGNACGAKIKTVTTGYVGARKGTSIRIMKGVSYHTGGSAGKAVREQVLETSSMGTFVMTGNRFVLMTSQYGFSIKDDLESNNYIIGTEWLLVNDKEVFDRINNDLIFGKAYEKELQKIDKVRNDRLYIGTLDYFADGEVKVIVDGFKEYLKKNFNVHFEVIIESSIKGMVSGISISRRLLEDEDYKSIIERFLRVADIGISGLRVEPVEGKNGKKYKIKTIHDVYDDKGVIVKQEEFDMREESSGTIRYFSFIQYILNMMDNGGVFIVDEISARLHPVLTKFIVDLYQSEKNKKAQLVFTTHDISLMNRKQFRRDEIAFVDKNERGESSIYTLADIRARSDASFSKDYLYGKYGAIPVIRDYEEAIKEMVGEWTWED